MRFVRLVIAIAFIAGFVSQVGAATATEKEEFGGLGLSVAQIYNQETEDHQGDLVVLDVIANADAQKQGVEKGDVITQIDGMAVAGKSFGELVTKHLRGKIGSVSEIIIKRAGKVEPLIVKVTRVKIVYQSEKNQK